MEKETKTLHTHLAVIEKLFVVGCAIMLLTILIQNVLWSWIIRFLGFGIMVIGVLYSDKHFKCPHCGSKLDPRRNVPNCCPNCGEKLF